MLHQTTEETPYSEIETNEVIRKDGTYRMNGVGIATAAPLAMKRRSNEQHQLQQQQNEFVKRARLLNRSLTFASNIFISMELIPTE